MSELLKSWIKKIKKWYNDLDYQLSMNSIMSEAIEYGEDPDAVDFYLKNNYKNHYPDGE